MIVTCIAAVVLGLFIGVFSGLLGIGGGTVMLPMYRLAFGMSALATTATSLFTIIPTSVSGVVSHLRNKTCIPKLGLAMGIGGALTSPIGVWLAQISPSWAVMIAAALVIGYSAFNMMKKVVQSFREQKATEAIAEGEPTAHDVQTGATPSVVEITSRHLALGVVIGLIAGVASGYVGVGGGFLMVPLMLTWLNLPMKKASGTSLIAIMLVAFPAAVEQGILGNIDFLVGIMTAVGTIPGAFIGARLVSRVPERTLRILFSVFLAVGAVLLVAKEVVLLG